MTGVRSSLDRIAILFASGFGSGFSRFAPGTAGTVAAALIVYCLSFTRLPAHWTLLALAAGSTAIGILIGRRVERICGIKDPGLFVLDEFAGFFVATMVFGPSWPGLTELCVAFGLFRLMDIVKPQPCRWLQDLGGGRGIVLDDVAAGLYALAGVVVYRDIMQSPPW